MKRVIAFILCTVMVIGFVPANVLAASTTLAFEEGLAQSLKELGLFKGVSETDFALGRAPTRVESIVMLIRILGKEAEAISKGGKHPFLDVPAWADKYVGFAYQNNLTKGVSATKFGSNSEASASMYITFVLRALGYSDTNGDFTWDNPYTLARQAGIMDGNPNVLKFLRADVVLVSYASLEAEVKGTGKTLAEKLISAGAFSAAEYDTYYKTGVFEQGEAMKGNMSAEEVYEKCSPAVFYIELYDKDGNAFGRGSGFFISSDGTAVTNFHVIKNAYSANIICPGRSKIYDLKGVYDYNEKNDWAIIKVEGNDFPYLELETEAVKGGETVYAIGSPRGLQNTISEGLISNVERNIDGVKYIQTSAPISPGSSGGALINTKGKVVGITSAFFTDGQNLNLAIPVSAFKGYRKQNAHSLAAAAQDGSDRYFGTYDFSALDDATAAFNMIKMWFPLYANGTLDGEPVYYQEFDYEDGSIIWALSYDDDNDMAKTTVIMSTDSQSSIDVSFPLGGNYAYIDFRYYYDVNDVTPMLSGTANVWRNTIYDGCTVSFNQYKGDWDLQYDAQELAGFLAYYALAFMDEVFYPMLSYYGDYSATDLGFVNLYK